MPTLEELNKQYSVSEQAPDTAAQVKPKPVAPAPKGATLEELNQLYSQNNQQPDAHEYAGDKPVPDAWHQAAYGWKKEKNWFQSGTQALEAVVTPNPRYNIDTAGNAHWETAKEYYAREYGPQFYDMSFSDRVKFLEARRMQGINKQYADVVEYAKAIGRTPGAVTAGGIAKDIIAPETLIPFGGGAKAVLTTGAKLKTLAKAGAAWGAMDRTLSDIGTKGEVDPTASVYAAMIGAVATPTVGFLGMKLSGRVKKIFANRTMSAFERDVAHQMSLGTEKAEAIKNAYARFELNPQKMSQLKKASGRNPSLPESRSEANALVSMEAEKTAEAMGSKKSSWAGDLLRPIYDKIYDMSKPIYSAMQRYEYKVMGSVFHDGEAVRPWLVGLSQYDKKVQGQIGKALANGDYRTVYDLIRRNGNLRKVPVDATALFKKKHIDMVEETKNLRKLLDNIYKDAKARGMNLEKMPGYFPRLPKGPIPVSPKQQKEIDAAMKDIEKTFGTKITAEQKTAFTEKMLQGMIYGKDRLGRLTWTRARKITKLNDLQMKAYADPAEALHTYIHKMRNEMYRREFLGIGKADSYDVDASISGFLQKHGGAVKSEDAKHLSELIKARLVMGEQQASSWSRKAKSLTYGATLANPISALTQLTDVGISAGMNGIGNTLKAVFGKRYSNAIQLGMSNASAEMVNVSKTSHFVNKLLRYSGFQGLDRLGKNVHINARYLQLHKMALKNPAKLEQEIRHLYLPQELPKVMESLKNKGEMSDLVQLALFDRVTQVQPITLGQMPLDYLNNPKLRIFYTLKTFTIRQMGTLYNQLMRDFKKHPVRNTANVAKLMTFIAATGATVGQMQNLLKGQWDDKNFTDEMFDNFFKIFGGSLYLADKAHQGKFTDVMSNLILPAPLSLAGNTGASVYKVLKGEKSAMDTPAVMYIPFIGRFLYYTQGAGKKKTPFEKSLEAQTGKEIDWEKEFKQ